jgi:cbb3-type cytochrome oxidase subunit 1
MTVNRNPKKSRPYDEPPKRRRTLIPRSPDSAATGFFVAAALWLVVSTGIGALAIGIRLIPFEFAFPIGLFDLGFELSERRIDAAFLSATAYGWLGNAGFAAILFMTPRLTGRTLAGERLVNVGLAIWNMALAGGIGLLYLLPLGPNAPLTAMPWFVTGGLATGALIVTGSFLLTAGSTLRSGYVSTWFAGVALLSVLSLLGLQAAVGLASLFFEFEEVLLALISFVVERGIVVLWLLGVAYATLFYVVPRATGQPLASGGLALLTFVLWLLLAPGSILAELRTPEIPVAVTTLGSVATMLLLVPASLAAVNLTQTMQGRWTLLFGTNAIAFAAVALAFLLATSLLEAIAGLRTVDLRVGRTDWELGVLMWSTYGTFTFAAFALAEHAIPRLFRRSWGGGPLSSAQLWLAFGGVTVAGLALMGGGLAQGSLVATGTAPELITPELMPYRAVAFLGVGLVALAGLAMLANLFLMYTSGEPAEYAVGGQTATAAAGH